MKKNRYTLPYDVSDSVICDFDIVYRIYLVKVEKNKKEGRKDHPSNKTEFKFRSIKDPQQSFEIRHRDFNAKNSGYNFLFKMEKFKSLSKHEVFNDNGK